MTLKPTLMMLIATAALAAPLASFAQSYDQGYGQSWRPPSGYGQPTYPQDGYDRPRGDFDAGRRAQLGVYPQFRSIEDHIQREIWDGLREDELAPDDAHALIGQLRRIQFEEAREYRAHGWNLPYDDQARIRDELGHLDHSVDETRAEP